jgi:hypothetical protein
MVKNIKKFCKNFGLLFFSVLFVFVVFGATVHAVELTPEEKAAYKKALEDTKETTQSEISRELLAVVPRVDVVNYTRLYGDDIIWENPDHPDESRVLVVALMDEKTYNDNYKAHMTDDRYKLVKSLWVTVVPEMRNFFIGNECPPNPNRLIKVLGLNPEQCAAYDVLVEMWVDPKDLFRPSPDPEITDHESELATRTSPLSDYWIYPSDINPFLLIDPYALFRDASWTLPGTFKEWYRDRAATIYSTTGEDVSKWGSPWTRLGYTYDWGNADNHVGLSEFIIRIDPYAAHVYVKLERAIIFDEKNPHEWNANFRCGPKAPMMALTADSSGVSIVWAPVQDADGYYVKYKAAERGSPFEPPFENEIDVGDTTEFNADLSSGDCFHVAIQAYNTDGRGGISNTGYFHIP